MPRATTAATLVTGLVLLAGCASSGAGSAAIARIQDEPAVSQALASNPKPPSWAGLTAQQLWDRTAANLGSVRSAHVESFIPAQGKRERVQFLFTMTDDGRAYGTMQNGLDNILIRRVGSVIYCKANRGFWDEDGTEPKATAKAGRWLKVTQGGNDRVQKFFALTDLHTVLDTALGLSDTEVAALTRIPSTSMTGGTNHGLGNLPANPLTKYPGSLYVSTKGVPLLLRMGPKDKPPYMTFNDWNQPVKFILPKNAVPLESLT